MLAILVAILFGFRLVWTKKKFMVSLDLFKYKHNFYLYLKWSRLVAVLNVLILNGWDDKPNTIDHPKSEHVWLLSHHWSLPSMKSEHLNTEQWKAGFIHYSNVSVL